VITLGKIHAEVKLLRWLLSIVTHSGELGDNLSVKHHDSSIFETAWNSEAPLGSSINVREDGSIVITDVLLRSVLAKFAIADLTHGVWCNLTVSFAAFLSRNGSLELAEFLDA
jgi:hypothetical protein